jgi:hypothetical protein
VLEWLSTIKLRDLVDANTDQWTQASQAIQIRNELVMNALRGMENADAAANIEMTKKLLVNFDEEVRALEGKYSGTALYNKIINDAQAELSNGCFVAGTLVHTQEGLKPIEQIQVGDYVLSKPESGEGELSYQRVTRTYEYEDREVYFVSWIVLSDGDKVTTKGQPNERGYVVVTGAHPIWIAEIDIEESYGQESITQPVNRWMSVASLDLMKKEYDLKGGRVIFTAQLSDGRLVYVDNFAPIVQNPKHPTKGIVRRGTIWYNWDGLGIEVEFNQNGPSVGVIETLKPWHSICYKDSSIERDWDLMEHAPEDLDPSSLAFQGFHPMCRTVYNVEVEHSHTYFVGEHGLWVHNLSGLRDNIASLNPLTDLGIFMQQKGEAAM